MLAVSAALRAHEASHPHAERRASLKAELLGEADWAA